ncbi:NtaA/DmoA family FMN-dependent monooxygenase [Herbiconiux moechotypicola]|uniref:NtaA/DmoA family FMN-dependent monooxygenase n=1 Tax=Herbiconiux moechotypicola TaxID=637393 RepID=A0ABP5QFE6_9MICO|nr:NtaA/DmoA family FMN-dependent monooxygenase [Herbiconiux moechotypicola]MCS5730005.1 NtaA/DmoA family FMN-dependent monooxygenase [Herbiconiux moechotypicola]
MFHLAWFLNGYSVSHWHGHYAGINKTEWAKPDLYVDLTRSLERAGFDALFIEDTTMIDDTYGGSMEAALKYGIMAPKNDPMPLVPLLAHQSKHIGLVSTVSTIQYHPFLAARLGATLDHLTEGRFGFNVVTSVSHRVAQNFGFDEHLPHAERYAMAEEWLDAVGALWNSWEPDALVLDEETPMFADHTKVHTVDFEGTYFRTRGPLSTVPGPQHRPVVAQAGNSGPGRDLAARNADMMLALANTPEGMKEIREDMHRRLRSYGRNPDDFKIFFMCQVYLGETDDDARRTHAAEEAVRFSEEGIVRQLWTMSYASGGVVDYSTLDLDAPLPDTLGNGETTTMKALLEGAGTVTLRDRVMGPNKYGYDFIGSSDSVAAQMDEVMQEMGGDGYLIFGSTRRTKIAEITDGLAPALRRRGLIRESYDEPTFRQNLLAF